MQLIPDLGLPPSRYIHKRVLKDFWWFIRHQSSVVESVALRKFSNPKDSRFDSGRKHVNSDSHWFEHIDPQSRVLNYCFQLYEQFKSYSGVLCKHIRIHICRHLVHLDSSGPPGVSSRHLGSQSSTPYVWCVWVTVCVYTHIHPHTLPPAFLIDVAFITA